MNLKGQRGNCIYNRQWELNSKYKGWLAAFKADRKRPYANAVIEWSTFQTWESLHWNRTWKVKGKKTTAELEVNSQWRYLHSVLYHVEMEISWSRKSGSIAIITTSCDDYPSAASRRCNSKITTILEGHVTRIMCLKLKNSRHWNLLQVPIHLTRPRTLLNCFHQCSLTVKLLGNLFVESEKQHIVVYLVWLNTSKSCSKTVSVDLLLYCLMKA